MPSTVIIKQNQKGEYYATGKSMAVEVREIVQRYIQTENVTKAMKLTHGVVSNITQHYHKTSLIVPRNLKSVEKDTGWCKSRKPQSLF
uniref:Transposase n=1 Tax=Panagrellus redivivus TaxID=6233 RepID=A0A7E4UQ72_PANRE